VLVQDAARFLPEDPAELVAAAFTCPWCLRRAEAIVLDEGDHEGVAGCRCAECEETWTVALSVGQLLRLALAPPEDLTLRRIRH
jgi:hypothetical protein